MIVIQGKRWTEEQFKKIITESLAKGDCARKLGFDYYSGSLWKLILANINALSISIEHFDSNYYKKVRRGLVKEISQLELSEKINDRLTLKELAKHFNCSSSNIKYWIKKFGLKLFRGSKGKLPKDHVSDRLCSRCGEINIDKFYGNKKTICAKCHNKYTLKMGQDNRLFAIDFLGGKCKHCGFCEFLCSLDIHHLDPSLKDPSFKSARGWAKERLLRELESCVLLCRNCHAAIHSGLIKLCA